MKCPKCGANTERDAKFCGYCGNPISTEFNAKSEHATGISHHKAHEQPSPGVEIGMFGKRCKKCGGTKFVARNTTMCCGCSGMQNWVCQNCEVTATDFCGKPIKVNYCLIPFVFIALGFCSKALAYFLGR